MKLTGVEKKEKSTVELSILVEREDFEAACEKAYRQNVGKINIQGFRKGKAPRKMIEKMYGDTFFHEDAVNIIYPDAYDNAVKEAGIEPVGRPALTDFDIKDGVFTFKAGVPVKPEVTVKDYFGVEAVKPSFEIADSEVDAEIDRFAERNARLVPVERKVENGDTVSLDFEGFDEGVAFEGGKGENFALKIGSGQFIPGFEEQIVGREIGENFDVFVTFPEQYQEKKLAGKPVVFKCKVNEVKMSEKPALDDEFAKDVSEFETLSELRGDIKTRMSEQRAKGADSSFEESVLDKVILNLEGEIPDAMIDSQIDRTVEDFAYRLSMQGVSLDAYLKMNGMEPHSFRRLFQGQSERQVKIRLAVEKIAELENVSVSDEEVDTEVARLSELHKLPIERILELVSKPELKKDVVMQKTVELLKSKAVAIDAPPPSEDAETPAKPAKVTKAPKAAKKPDDAETTEAAEQTEPAKKPARKSTKPAPKSE